MGFHRQEHWNGLPFPPAGDLLDRGVKLMSPALAGGFFTTEPPGKTQVYYYTNIWIKSIAEVFQPLLYILIYVYKLISMNISRLILMSYFSIYV